MSGPAAVGLEPITPATAARILSRDERTGDRWHPQYPFEDERDPLQMLVRDPDPDPVFTLYVIRDETGVAAPQGFARFSIDSKRDQFVTFAGGQKDAVGGDYW